MPLHYGCTCVELRLAALVGESPEAEMWNEAWESPEAGPFLCTDMPITARTLIPCGLRGWNKEGHQRLLLPFLL